MDPCAVPMQLSAPTPSAQAQQERESAPPNGPQSVRYQARRPERENSRWERQVDLASLSTAQPRPWRIELSNIRRTFIRQILGLNPFRTSYFALYRPLKDTQSKVILLGGFLLAIAAGIPLPIIGVVFGKIINNFPPSEEELRTRLGQLMGVAVAYFAITWGWAVCWGVVGERVSRGLREALVERALGMELAFFDVESPDMASILTDKTQTVQLGTSEKVGLFIQSISYFVAAFTVGFILDAKLTGILLVAVIPAMAIIVYFGTKSISALSNRATEYTQKASSIAESAIRAVQIVQAFGISDELAKDHLRLLQSALQLGIRKSIAGAVMLGSVYFVAYAANALAFWEGKRQQEDRSNQSGGAGTIYAVVFLILDASFVVGQFGPFIQTFALAAAAGQSIFALLDHPEPHINVYSDDGAEANQSAFSQGLRFHDVSFVYPARPTVRVLDSLSLDFRSGTVTGIVGSSGSGKSTIAALLLRLYDPTSGRITLGSEDIRQLNIASLRSNISLVDQHSVIFSGTILENIKHGLPRGHNLSEQEILKSCSAAASDAHCDFISLLPKGLNTMVGGSGSTQLSGGQKQRICLARALVGNPSLLILDEYTSAMDANSEAIVLEALKRSSSLSGRTTIVIAHRLATVKDADEILVMGDGTLLERGKHDALIKSDGAYKALIEAQKFEKAIPSSANSPLLSSTKSSITGVPSRSEKPCSPKSPQSSQLPQHAIPNKRHFELVRRCLSLSKSESPFIVLGLFASMISGGIIMGEALIFGNLVQILNKRVNTVDFDKQADFFCLMFFILSLVAFLAYSVSGSAFGVVSERLILRIRDKSLRTILMQDMSWFFQPAHSSHALMSKLNMDAGHLAGLSGVILGTIFSVVTSVVGGIILAHIVAWKIAVVLLAAVPIMLLAGFLRLRVLAKAEQRHQTAYNNAAALASEACAAIRTVAALGREKDVLRLYKEAIRIPYEKSLKFTIWGNVLLAFSLSITYFVYALAYWWGSKQVRNGRYGQLQFFIVLPALLFSAQAAGQMFSVAPEITRAQAAAQSVFELHDQRPSIISDSEQRSPSSPGNSTEKSLDDVSRNGRMKQPSGGQLEFRDVSLTYDSRPDSPALKQVSLSVRAGEFIAFVGRSGAGKSSSISLIERFFDPTSGSVFLDGRDIRTEPVQLHRARIGLVEQEPELFPGSVMFNIKLGARPGQEVSPDDVASVCKRCGLHGFIMSLPEGYNTECGFNGSRLSGGQRQRIAIARALIRDPEILLLDEATSQLDSQTEQEVRRAIAVAASGRTTIMVAHRLASVQHADCIYVFDHGCIVEQGKHDELVGLGGLYAGMVAAQELN
ncbi:leptomycin B resistance protein pmd1 [Glonium stellatum]|uniref:Leptomycin B resistance protein pmd1 n=1 Tax=Glonium stellatum TaxID=574774 RepID=A0A8E2JR63_9PEZI|nr:leptomycin B resistance protein pmd1 [Glonium stellatum]